ncbi:MAG: chalcone isomerase family protein [Hylemonella sp.]|nr:chalcone isomerase family protein [Hylemonella sp.]
MLKLTYFMPLLVALATPATPALASTQASGAPTGAAAAVMLAPDELMAFGPGWALRGSGVLRFFGFKAYDANLWQLPGGREFSYARPFALDIRYATSIKGADIVNTSLIELSRITPTPTEKLNAWSAFMNRIFVDVKSGDRLVGLHLPGRGVRFFLNGRLLGESSDEAFSEAFFKIWLDPQTKRPELRLALLGPSATAVAQ